MEQHGYPGFWMRSTKSKLVIKTVYIYLPNLNILNVFVAVPEAAAERGEGGCLYQAASPAIQ